MVVGSRLLHHLRGMDERRVMKKTKEPSQQDVVYAIRDGMSDLNVLLNKMLDIHDRGFQLPKLHPEVFKKHVRKLDALAVQLERVVKG